MLRKFHASALYNDGMSLDKVNDLQGKAKNKTDTAYFMTNPDDLKYEYIQHLPAVTINTDVEKLSVKSPQFIQMEKENEALKSEVGDMRNELEEMRGLKKELLGIINKVSEAWCWYKVVVIAFCMCWMLSSKRTFDKNYYN